MTPIPIAQVGDFRLCRSFRPDEILFIGSIKFDWTAYREAFWSLKSIVVALAKQAAWIDHQKALGEDERP